MAADQMQRLGLNATQAAGAVTRQMVGQAYLLASTDLFRLSAWLAGGLTVLVWLVRRPAAHDGPVAAD
jgi:DHA2 family multidrug resistance protein